MRNLNSKDRNPLFTLLVIAISIFVVEMTVAYLLYNIISLSPIVEALIVSILTLMLCPLVYLFLFRPLLVQVKERRRAEEALQRERDVVQKYLDIAGVIVVIIKADQTVSFVNKKGCEILKCEESEIIGKNWFDNFVVDRVRTRIRNNFEKLLAGEAKSTGHYETRVLPKRGRERTIGWHHTILKDQEGKIIATLNSGQDITNYKRAKREIQLLAKFPAESPSPVLRIRKDGCLQFANQASWPILKALKGKEGEFVSDKWKQIIKDVYTSQKSTELELKCQNLFFLITITPFTDTDYLYVYGRDITEHKRAEIELAKHHQQLEELVGERTAELEKSNQELQNEISERKRTEEKLRFYQEQLRSLASELSLAEEQERRRIAVGLHDHIGQSLYLSKLRLEAMQKSAPSLDFTDSLKEITKDIDETLHRTRSLTFDISPPILYDLGFEPALKWLADQVHKQHGLASSFEDDKQPKPLDDDVRVLLYQSVRELFANVVKHAQASEVKISVRREASNIRIELNDDGIGFDTSKIFFPANKKSGFGFFSIRERLNYLGGYLECKSKPGQGTRVSLLAPLKDKGSLAKESGT